MSEQQLATQIAETASHYDIGDFIDGQRDCRDGATHQDGKGDSYDAGYNAQYTLEQMRGAN